jgi:hypothetical protein
LFVKSNKNILYSVQRLWLGRHSSIEKDNKHYFQQIAVLFNREEGKIIFKVPLSLSGGGCYLNSFTQVFEE